MNHQLGKLNHHTIKKHRPSTNTKTKNKFKKFKENCEEKKTTLPSLGSIKWRKNNSITNVYINIKKRIKGANFYRSEISL